MENTARMALISPNQLYTGVFNTLPLFDWLSEQNHEIGSWELFVRTKDGDRRTSEFGPVRQPVRDEGSSPDTIRGNLQATLDDWTSQGNGEPLIFMFNLKDDFDARVKRRTLSPLVRGVAGFLAISGVGVFVLFVVMLIMEGEIPEPWHMPFSGLIGAAFFGYAAITGDKDFYFMEDILGLKIRTRSRTTTETGEPRWPKQS